MLASCTNSALVDPVGQFGQVCSWPADFDYLSFWWVLWRDKERWILSCRLVVSVALVYPYIKQKLLVWKELKGKWNIMKISRNAMKINFTVLKTRKKEVSYFFRTFCSVWEPCSLGQSHAISPQQKPFGKTQPTAYCHNARWLCHTIIIFFTCNFNHLMVMVPYAIWTDRAHRAHHYWR